jgi:N-6 DNA Methylase
METFLHVGGRKGKADRGQNIDFDELGVSDVVELLDDAKMEAIVRDFGDLKPEEDPVTHFYELFLNEFDQEAKKRRGVFYTPRPVVSYIVRSVDELLRAEFGLADGLADTATWGEMAKRHKDLAIPEGVTPDQAFVQFRLSADTTAVASPAPRPPTSATTIVSARKAKARFDADVTARSGMRATPSIMAPMAPIAIHRDSGS